jgi:hypothetical protein
VAGNSFQIEPHLSKQLYEYENNMGFTFGFAALGRTGSRASTIYWRWLRLHLNPQHEHY